MLIMGNQSHVQTCKELVREYRQSNRAPKHPEHLVFENIGTNDVYNIAAPFVDAGEVVIAGRVEERDSEHSQVQFFIFDGQRWTPRPDAPVFKLQDPFFTFIHNELIFGGVEIFPHPTIEGALGWRTVFYRGNNINELTRFFVGPDGMKDLRIVELVDGKIGVFTRPQGEKGGRGKIGFTSVDKLEDLSIDFIESAPLLQNQFTEEEWGGANEIHVLSNGLLGVLGHIACFDNDGNRHYYPMVFSYDPVTKQRSQMKVIAERANFNEGPTKRSDLVDVVFSGGLIRKTNGTSLLFAGISDAGSQQITIPDPFIQFEQ